MKRFTETDKWRDTWFRKLTPVQKCLWSYLLDNCDHAGVIDVDWELVSFQIGTRVKVENLAAFSRQIATLPNGKLWITGFIQYQYGKLSLDCKPHSPVFAALNKHGIAVEDVAQNGRPKDVVEGDVRSKIIDRDGLHCVYFDRPITEAEAVVDHVIARSKGGGSAPSNLVVACREANSLKSDLSLEEFCQVAKLDVEAVKQRVSKCIAKVIEGFPKASERLQDKTKTRSGSGQGLEGLVTADTVYDAYPRKEARQAALKAIVMAAKKCPLTKLLVATEAYASAVATWPQEERKFIPHPATWFNRGSYEDDPETWERKGSTSPDSIYGGRPPPTMITG